MMRKIKEEHMRTPNKNIPNLLSSFRIIAAPFLLIIAWQDRPNLFLAILAVSLLSDALDGFIARRFKATSKTGTKLDSWGDFVTYVTVAVCAWRLWPEILHREVFFVVAGIVFFALPVIAGSIKFKRLPCYHTWAAKIQAVLICIAIYILFITGIAWPFQCAVILQFFVSIEEIAITLWLTEQRHNIPSFWHLKYFPS
jgi:CDP-diacylglycerol--glycerol-3-phosphate 3-phosphatidyltransferase